MRLYEINAIFRPRRICHFIPLRINGSKFFFSLRKNGERFYFPFSLGGDDGRPIDVEPIAVFPRNRSIILNRQKFISEKFISEKFIFPWSSLPPSKQNFI